MLKVLHKVQEQLVGVKPIVPRALVHPDNKWLVRSGLQKAIRRGDVETALKCAGYLYNDDPTYLWRSLAIITIEDISIGNPELVWQVVAFSKNKKVRMSLGDLTLTAHVIEEACKSPKSRICCELSVSVDYSTEGIVQYNRYSQMSTEELVGWALEGNGTETLEERYLAICTLAGFVPRKTEQRRKRDIPGLTQVIDAYCERLPEEYHHAIKQCTLSAVDSMHLALAPILELSHNTMGGWEVEPDDMPIELRLKGLSGAALDMHNRQGKFALKAFYTSLRKEYEVIDAIPSEKAVYAMGSTVFVVEGGQVDRRLVIPHLSYLKDRQDEVLMLWGGVPNESLADVRDIVEKEIKRLNDKRRWVVSFK
jgi:hypothetical protein